MPALSPTMTEGNIASWRVKEGDSFSAGDVLLEIETDKATMDVEAQDDGVMVKVMQGEGSKGVKVGERIAVMAEPGDDLGSLEIPAMEEAGKEQGKAEETKAAEAPKPSAPAEPKAKKAPSQKAQPGHAQKQSYPLYPSVAHLLHQNGLATSEADQIPASGPNGRLLKGDVLAYLGQISKDYPSQSAARLTKLSHLDLSNIQLSKPAPKAETAPAPAAPVEPELPQETEIALPISLAAVIATQKRVSDSLGIFLPLSTFIARASELANEELPLSKKRTPTADELFNAVIGLDKVSGTKTSKGQYVPQVIGLAPAALASTTSSAKKGKKADIIDMLAPKQAVKKPVVRPGAVGVSTGENLFSVLAKSGEEARATEFLARMKMALEGEPGRLVL